MFVSCRATGENRQTALEGQVEYLISTNYESLREQLNRLDPSHHGTMTTNDMRALIEDLLEFPLRPDEFYQLLKRFPIDQNGKVKYKEYFKEVMERSRLQREDQEKSAV